MRQSPTMGSLVVLLGLGAVPVAAQDLAPCPSWDTERAQMVEAARQGAAALQFDLLGNAGPTFRLATLTGFSELPLPPVVRSATPVAPRVWAREILAFKPITSTNWYFFLLNS